MKACFAGILLVGLLTAIGETSRACEPAPATPKKRELRQPGFVFLELGTPRVAEYIEYFQAVAGFKLIRDEMSYASLETDLAQLLLIDPKLLPQGHPFFEAPPGGKRGYSVEIGLVVKDLDKTFAAASKFKDWRISSGIAARPWGVRDFRVLSPDGYYLRFTE